MGICRGATLREGHGHTGAQTLLLQGRPARSLTLTSSRTILNSPNPKGIGIP